MRENRMMEGRGEMADEEEEEAENKGLGKEN